MNKYSRQLRIGRVFVRRASSGRKYAILVDFTQCLVTQRFTLFCRLLSPFLRCRTGFFALRKSPFHVAIWYVRHRHTGNLAMRKSLFRRAATCFQPSGSPQKPPRHPFSHYLTHILRPVRSSFPISRCQTFYSLKRINIRSFTARPSRNTFSVVLRRHIFPRPSALKRFPDTPFPAP